MKDSSKPNDSDRAEQGKRTLQITLTLPPGSKANIGVRTQNDGATTIACEVLRDAVADVSEMPLREAKSSLGTGLIDPDAQPNQSNLPSEMADAANEASAPLRDEAKKRRDAGEPRESSDGDKLEAKAGLMDWVARRLRSIPGAATSLDKVCKAGVWVYRIGSEVIDWAKALIS